MSVAATPTFRRDVTSLGLVGAGHFVSRFYSLGRPDLVVYPLVAFPLSCVLASVAPKEHRTVEVR